MRNFMTERERNTAANQQYLSTREAPPDRTALRAEAIINIRTRYVPTNEEIRKELTNLTIRMMVKTR